MTKRRSLARKSYKQLTCVQFCHNVVSINEEQRASFPVGTRATEGPADGWSSHVPSAGEASPSKMFSIPRQTFKISYVLWKIPSAKSDQNLRDSVEAIFSVCCKENGSQKTQHTEPR